MALTIEDIAKEAGVSIATVSRVMNNTKAVSPELKERVSRIIEKNNFIANPFARGLITKKTQMIGVIVPDISNPVYGILVKGMNQICQLEGYTLLLHESRGEKEKELELLKTLDDKNIDGVIIASTNSDKPFVKELSLKEYPIVLIGGKLIKDTNSLNVVYHDARKASFDATNLILKYGHSRIAFIGNKSSSNSISQDLYEGFNSALSSLKLRPIDSYIEYGDDTYVSGFKCMKKILQFKEIPTAVLACNDSMAIGAIHYIQSIGLKVPKDISVMGMDGLEVNSYFNPTLTTVKFPYLEEGIMSANIIFERINKNTKTNTYYLEHKIVNGNSLIPYENLSSDKEMAVYLL